MPLAPATAADPVPAISGPAILLTEASLIITDALALLLTGIVATLALHLLKVPSPLASAALLPLVLLPVLAVYLLGGLYPGIGSNPVVELRQITRLNSIVFLTLTAGSFLPGLPPSWRVFFGVSGLVCVVLAPLFRSQVRRFGSRRAWWGYPAVVFTTGETSESVIDMLLQSLGCGLRPCCIVDPTGRRRGTVQGVPFVSRSTLAKTLARNSSIRYAIISFPHLSRSDTAKLIEIYANNIPRLLILSHVSDMPSLWSDTRQCGNLSGIEVQNRLLVPVIRYTKRSIDILVTLLAATVALPLVLTIASLMRLTVRGPIFFSHLRIGLNGRKFKAWKICTMIPNSAEALTRHLAENPAAQLEWERDHKLKHDPRVTPLGRFLRRSSLDELPQLWNVLKGEMSLVGPRPIVDDEVAKYGGIFRLYKEVKPGITGLWQVSGRNNTTYAERLELDNYYVRNWSPWLDIYILARTIRTIIRREGAY